MRHLSQHRLGYTHPAGIDVTDIVICHIPMHNNKQKMKFKLFKSLSVNLNHDDEHSEYSENF